MRNGLILTLLLAALPAAARDSLDVTDYEVVYQVPGMDRALVTRDLPYGAGLHFDLTLPPGAKQPPLIVFVNGVGDPEKKLKDWTIYRSWARLVAARGYAAVMAEVPQGKVAESIAALFAHLAREGGKLGFDPTRIGVWACSANVAPTVPFLMDGKPAGVRAAVLLYGNGEAKAIRADLPVMHVLAGRDGQLILERERALRAQAIAAKAPWTLVEAPTLPHAFDAVDPSEASRAAVAQVLAFFDANLQPLPPAPPGSPEREIVIHQFAAEPQEAERLLADLVRKEPKNAAAVAQLVRMKAQRGDCDSVAVVAKSNPDDAGLIDAIGRCQLIANKPAEAAGSFERALAKGFRPPVTAYNLACAHARAGHTDAALKALERAVAAGFRDKHQIESDADLASLRGDARFVKILGSL